MAGSVATANLVEEKLSHLQLTQENDNLKSQVSQNVSPTSVSVLWFCCFTVQTVFSAIIMHITWNVIGTRSYRESRNAACETNARQGTDERLREDETSNRATSRVQS